MELYLWCIQKSKEGGWLFGSRDNKKSEELEVIRQELEDKIIENGKFPCSSLLFFVHDLLLFFSLVSNVPFCSNIFPAQLHVEKRDLEEDIKQSAQVLTKIYSSSYPH